MIIEYVTFNGEKRKLKEWVTMFLFFAQIGLFTAFMFSLIFAVATIIYIFL